MKTADPAAQAEGASETAERAQSLSSSYWRVPVACWIVVVLVVLILLERLRSPQTFFFDEWDFVFDRRSGGVDSILTPHNGHLSAVPALVYRALFQVFGLDHYRPYRVVGLLVHAAVATTVFHWLRTRIGALPAIALGTLILLLGSGWNDIFWPFQIGFMGSVASGVIAWAAIERRTRRSDLLAAVAVGISLSCSGLGIAVALAAACRLAAERAWTRAARVLAGPVALYGVWYLAYGQSQGSGDNLRRIPRFVVDAGATSAAALGARDLLWGRLAFGVLIGVAVTLFIQRRGLPKSVIAPAVCALTNWILIGYSRAQFGDPGASRYVYVGAVLLVLVCADLFAIWPRRFVPPMLVIAALLGIWGNWATLHAGARNLQQVTLITRAELRALEWARGYPSADYRPDESRMPQVTSGEYFAAIDALGSPAASDAEVQVDSADAQTEADRVSIQVLGLQPTVSAPPASVVDRSAVSDGSRLSIPSGSCVGLTAPVGAADLKSEIAVDSGSQIMITASTAPIDVRLRRYSANFPNLPTSSIPADSSASLSIPRDLAPTQTWIVDVRSTEDMIACNITS